MDFGIGHHHVRGPKGGEMRTRTSTLWGVWRVNRESILASSQKLPRGYFLPRWVPWAEAAPFVFVLLSDTVPFPELLLASINCPLLANTKLNEVSYDPVADHTQSGASPALEGRLPPHP
eukprot:1711828-Amphidinium_carterae.1